MNKRNTEGVRKNPRTRPNQWTGCIIRGHLVVMTTTMRYCSLFGVMPSGCAALCGTDTSLYTQSVSHSSSGLRFSYVSSAAVMIRRTVSTVVLCFFCIVCGATSSGSSLTPAMVSYMGIVIQYIYIYIVFQGRG